MSALREYDLDLAGTSMHCYEAGEGHPLVFVHGSGPGVDTLSNFGRVMEPLAVRYRVVGIDLVGFGRSGRRPEPPYFDMSTWCEQVERVAEHLGTEQLGVVGHSLGGPIVLRVAARRADLVSGVIVTGTMGVPSAGLSSGGPRWGFPSSPDVILGHVQRTMFDPSQITPGEVERRSEVLYAEGYREYFSEMFADAERCIDDSVVDSEDLRRIECRVALIHGRYDKTFPPEETTLVLAKLIRRADVHVLDRCAHSVAHERPETFMAIVDDIFGETGASVAGVS